MRFAVVVAAAFAAVAVHAAITGDYVDGRSLPGWNQPLPSAYYSGYLDIPGGKHLHYTLAMSESNPAKDPLVIWFNGGPGCSSLDAFMYEHGPLHVVEPYPTNGTVPTLYLNPYRWNQIASVMFLEAPACVGFSYADTAAGCNNNDTQQAIDNYAALQVFYKGFPELATNPLFITGESYAGVYVPTLALQILANSGGSIPLKGIAVGNGVIGDAGQDSTAISVEFLHGHGLFSDAVYNSIQANCPNFNNPSIQCMAALNAMASQVGHVNIYDIIGPCINNGFPPAGDNAAARRWRRPVTKVEQVLFDALGVTGPDACIDAGAATTYLNIPAVRSALHISPKAFPWVICTDNLNYDVIQPSLLPFYKNQLIPNIRVTIYNGDHDACVPYNGNEQWTSSLNISVVSAWRPWTVDKQVAGYVTTYASNFNFVTFKAAGHMVPQTQPANALEFFRRFINNLPY